MSQKSATPCIVCGPSGVGKGTLLNTMKKLFPNTFGVAVSHTTRKSRPGEKNGVHYNFTSREVFEKGIKNGEFVEYANINGNYYGTSFEAIKDIQNKNEICILEIDVVGAKIIKDSEKIKNANYLFITTTGGIETLQKRLLGRNTETEQQIKRRLDTARRELTFLTENDTFFGCVLSNDNLQECTQQLTRQIMIWYPWINIDLMDDEKDANDATASCPIVLCGPSGVGKGTLLKRVKQILPHTFGVAVSHTTRKPRPGEKDGVDYHFTDIQQFEKGIQNGQFVEYANINGNYYGTSIQAIGAQANGKENLICILEIDVVGAKIIKDSGKNANYLFITTNGGLQTLKKRLMLRNTETDEQIERRLVTAEKEWRFLNENGTFFDCVLSNDNDNSHECAQRLARQFKAWYPWIITHRLEVIDAAYNNNTNNNDDEKKTSSNMHLMIEKETFSALFNALQFDGAHIYDLRSKDEYNRLHAMGAINISDSGDINKLIQNEKKRIFIYGIKDNNNNNIIKHLYGMAQKLNVVQFCVITDPFDSFKKVYPFLCVNNNPNCIPNTDRIRYPNCISNTQNRLYVGGESHAFNRSVIVNLGITHIVNTKGSESKLDVNIAKKIKYLNIKVDDSDKYKGVINFFDKSGEFIDNALTENNVNRVLVHCGGGKSRATTFTMAYLIKYKKQSFAFAYGRVSIDRPKTFPNDSFVNDLASYEMKIYNESTKHFIVKNKLRNKSRWKKVLISWNIQQNTCK